MADLRGFFDGLLDLLKTIKAIADEDSFRGYLVSILLIFFIIKFIIFPVMGFVLGGTDYPIVSVVSGSMEHKPVDNYMCGNLMTDSYIENFDNWWGACGDYYFYYNISKAKFEDFSMKNGFNIGDAMILYNKKPENIDLGDVIVYIRSDNKPIIHRVIKIDMINGAYHYTTKGDFNAMSASYEYDVSYEAVQGTVVFRIPFIGYPKYWLSKALGLL